MFLKILPLLAAIPVLAASDPKGLPNFHPVNDHIYRGAQPTADGFRTLAEMGVKTVIDLRGSEHSEAGEKRIVEAAGMRYVGIPMKGMAAPTEARIASALKEMNDPAAGRVFIHCKRGADRTGAVVACYRISHDGWNNSKALDEANGYGMSVFQVALKHYVNGFGNRSCAIVSAASLVPIAPSN